MQHQSREAAQQNQEFWTSTNKCIRWRSNRLTRKFRLSSHDREDLYQSMTLDVVRAMHKYDPARSSPETFVSRVLDKSYLHHARQLAGHRSRPQSVNFDPDMLSSDPRRSGLEDSAASAERAEVRHFTHLLPDNLAHLACQIGSWPVAEIANSIGVHRGTIYRQLKHLRPHFRSFGPKN